MWTPVWTKTFDSFPRGNEWGAFATTTAAALRRRRQPAGTFRPTSRNDFPSPTSILRRACVTGAVDDTSQSNRLGDFRPRRRRRLQDSSKRRRSVDAWEPPSLWRTARRRRQRTDVGVSRWTFDVSTSISFSFARAHLKKSINQSIAMI